MRRTVASAGDPSWPEPGSPSPGTTLFIAAPMSIDRCTATADGPGSPGTMSHAILAYWQHGSTYFIPNRPAPAFPFQAGIAPGRRPYVRSSNSPSFTPARNALISARVYTRAGLDGWRELRTAISPSGSAATSTQFPLGLLHLLFRQVTRS